MTIREYITQKLPAFNLTEADFMDLPVDDIDKEYHARTDGKLVGTAMVTLIEELAFRPHLKNINESGFSANWEYDLGKFYMLLCRRHGITPNADVCGLLGISTITFLDAADYF